MIWAQVRYNHPQMKDAGIQAKKTKTILAWQEGDPRGLDALLPGLEPEPDDTVVLKRNPSAFFGTSLATELQLLNVDTLVIGGVSTSGCVRATAMDAMCHGFRPMVSFLSFSRSLSHLRLLTSASGGRICLWGPLFNHPEAQPARYPMLRWRYRRGGRCCGEIVFGLVAPQKVSERMMGSDNEIGDPSLSLKLIFTKLKVI